MIYINNKEKLERIKKETDFFVITDFDRTLTTHSSEPSMGIIPGYLGGECYVERTKIFEHYRPIELDYTIEPQIKQEIMKEWAQNSFKLLSKYVTKKNIKDSINDANLHLRNGAKEIFKHFSLNDVPVIIMSSGFGNIVEEYLKKEECVLNNTVIVSNFFEFNEGKTFINLNNLMATSNKEYIRIPEKVRKIIETKKAGLLFGDLVEDLKMADYKNLKNILTFGFLDENIENNIEKFNKYFDIVLTENEDFNTVKKIINI